MLKSKKLETTRTIGKAILLVSIAFVFVLTLSGCFFSLIPGPFAPFSTEPRIKQGEFPFTLIYERDGEIVTVEDSLVIDYTGKGSNEGSGKYNTWNRYLKSRHVEAYTRYNVILYEGFIDNEPAMIYFELGSCEYYMGLDENEKYYYYSDVKPGDIVLSTTGYHGTISEEDLYANYHIKILKKEISLPISQ